jgi:hypothetical protein
MCDHARRATCLGERSDDHFSSMRDATDRLEQLIMSWLDWLDKPNSGEATTDQPRISIPAVQERSDDELPKSKRGDSPSRVKARAAYEYAMERIPGAREMTLSELFDAIHVHGEASEMIPNRPDTFRRYLNDCGIRLKKSGPRATGRSVARLSDI